MEDNGKQVQAKESTTEVTQDLRGDCERGHMMEDMRHHCCNENYRDLKRNRKGGRGNSGRLSWLHAGDVKLDSSFYNC